MSVAQDDGFIDQEDYEEFAGVENRDNFEEADDGMEDGSISNSSEISPNWQIATEHTFTQQHFCKVTSCTPLSNEARY